MPTDGENPWSVGPLTPPCISKNLLHNTLALQTFAYIDVTNGGVFNRLFLAVLVKNQ